METRKETDDLSIIFVDLAFCARNFETWVVLVRSYILVEWLRSYNELVMKYIYVKVTRKDRNDRTTREKT
jgi:hypothetical protein